MKKRLFTIFLAACILGSMLTGCGSGEKAPASEAPSASDDGSAEAPAAEDDIIIGALYPMTGDLADSGKTMQQGIDMAVEEVNEAGGIEGRQVKVIYGDTQGDSATGMSEAERLITQENVDVLIGCYQSGVTLTVAQIAEQYEVPMITANATSDAITGNGYQYFFRLAPTNMMFVRDMIQYIVDESESNSEFSGNSVAVITDNSEVGQQTVQWAKYWAEQNGIQYLGEILFTSGAADLSSEVLQLKSMAPDVVIADAYVSDAILFTNTLSEQGYEPSLIVCKGNGFTEGAYLESVGTRADGIAVATEFVVGSKGVEISDKYYSKYGEELNGHSAEAYTTAWVLIDAFKEIAASQQELSHSSIRDELAKIVIDGSFSNGNEIILPYDTISFDEDEFDGAPYLNQNLNATLTMTQIQDSSYVTIWPYEIAESKLQYPADYQ